MKNSYEILEVIQPGPLTTIQDLGRSGYQQYGVPVAGAMDTFAFRVGNLLAGNNENTAALEITLMGLRVRVLADAVVAVTGGDLTPKLNNSPLPMWQPINVKAGDIIAFGWAKPGCRAYLAFAGGIDVPAVMGSRSTYVKSGIGGFKGRALVAGDRLESVKTTIRKTEHKLPAEFIPSYEKSNTIRVIMGPQDDCFTEEGIKTFLSSEYTVSNEADRTGYRLSGPVIKHMASAEIISDGIPAGAVQVPGSGLPIVLLADRQTTGGYPKIACVVTTDTAKLAQAKPGDRVKFESISLDKAHSLLEEYEKKLASIKEKLAKGG